MTPLRRILPIVTSLAAAIILAGCGGSSGQGDDAAGAMPADDRLFPLVFENDWLAVPEQGGFFQALVAGYYAEEGLAVTFRHGGPYDLTPQNVAVGKAQIGMGGSDEIILAVGKDLPLVIVAPFMQHHPYALMSYADHAVKSFDQLEGRTVTGFPGATWIPLVQHRAKVKFGLAPLTTSIAGFMADQSHRAIEQVFITNEPYFARRQGADIHVLRIGDSGWDPYRVIFTTKPFADEHPHRVAAFVRASLRGWQAYLHGDAAAADAMIREKNPSMTQDYIDFVRQTMIASKLVTGLADQGQADLRLDKIQQEIADLRAVKLLSADLRASDVASLDFLPDDPRPSPPAANASAQPE